LSGFAFSRQKFEFSPKIFVVAEREFAASAKMSTEGSMILIIFSTPYKLGEDICNMAIHGTCSNSYLVILI
jgi:hypothetical protein